MFKGLTDISWKHLAECGNSTSAVHLPRKLGAKSMHVHRRTALTQVSADGHAQMADHLCYHGAIAEAHDRDGHVHFPL